MGNQKISIFRSLAAKLFYYMIGLVLITVLGNSYQNFRAFSKYLSDNAATAMVSRAETTIAQVEAQIETWKSQVGIVVPTYSGDRKSYADVLERFVDSNPDFLALQVYSSPTKTSKRLATIGGAESKKYSDARFEDKVGATIISEGLVEANRHLVKNIRTMSKSGKNTIVLSLAKKSGLPIMMVATRFGTSNGTEVLWSVLICWQSPFIKSLPKSAFVDSALVDFSGRVFSSNSMEQMSRQSVYGSEALIKEATSAKKISDFVPEYRTASNRRVIGGYARIPEYGLAVLVEEDIENAYEEMNRNQYRTLLWAGLFVLISIMFAYLVANGITKNLRLVANATRKIAAGNFDEVIAINSNDEIAALAASVNSMSSEIVNLMKDNIAKAEIEKELTTAKIVQSTFFPKKDIVTKNLRASGFYQPATQCGGDLWGHYELSEDRHLLYIADAMGHGAPAALVTAIAYSVSATVANLAADHPGMISQPSDLLTHINKVICDAVGGAISMTFFCAFLDTKKGKMTYSNAGHNFPFLMPLAEEDSRRPKTKRSAMLDKPQAVSIKLMGNPLGMVPDAVFTDKEMEIKAGDKFFLFTDGLIECSSPSGEVWGRKHLLDQLSDTSTLTAEDLKNEILSRAFTFFAGHPLEDDVTVVVAEIPKSWKPLVITERTSNGGAPPPLPLANLDVLSTLVQIPEYELPQQVSIVSGTAALLDAEPASEGLIPSYLEAELGIDDGISTEAIPEGDNLQAMADSFLEVQIANSDTSPPDFSLESLTEIDKAAPKPEPPKPVASESKPKLKGRYKIKLPNAG